MKLLTAISLFLVFTFSVSADLTINDYKDLLRRQNVALIETTKLLEEANDTIKDQEEIISSLRLEISKSDSALQKEIEEKDDLLKKAKDALEASNVDLSEAKSQIESDQTEIEELRDTLQDCVDAIPEVEMFTLGGGYTIYPQGIQLLFMFDIPKIPISVYTNGGVNFNPFVLNFTIGAAYRF
jgi:hypothetical protein